MMMKVLCLNVQVMGITGFLGQVDSVGDPHAPCPVPLTRFEHFGRTLSMLEVLMLHAREGSSEPV